MQHETSCENNGVKNVLLIMTDQQRRDSLGCYGNTYTRTPNLDLLARKGCRFDRNYVANPICMPNRLSLMSGRMPSNHGLWTNGLLLDEQPTLSAWLRDQGYHTASIGKIHFTPYGCDEGNLESEAFWKKHGNEYDWNGPYWGFDHVELTLGHTTSLAHYGRWFYENGGSDDMLKPDPDTEVRSIPLRLHDSTFVAERSCDYLKQRDQDGQPFFLSTSFPDPHHPFNPPAEVAQNYDPAEAPRPVGSKEDLTTRPEHYLQHYQGRWNRRCVGERIRRPNGLDEKTTRQRIANTAAMVDLIDQGIGRILTTLEETGLAENTLVIFTSDHGELLGDHGLWLKGPFFYEGLINTPLLIAGPGVEAGSTHNGLSSAIDLVPTICEALGIASPNWNEGLSLLPMLQGKTKKVRDSCCVEYRNGYGENDVASRTLVTDRYKYTRYETGAEELTDLLKDPSESTNLAPDSDCETALCQARIGLLDCCVKSKSRSPSQLCHA